MQTFQAPSWAKDYFHSGLFQFNVVLGIITIAVIAGIIIYCRVKN